jgi:hypothetical protein
VWDKGALLAAPLRALLDQAAGLFPAYPRPYLRLLAALVEGPEAAGAALASLHSASIIAVVHDMEDPALSPEDGGEVALKEEVAWQHARDVVGTRLPQVGGGGGRGWAVVWCQVVWCVLCSLVVCAVLSCGVCCALLWCVLCSLVARAHLHMAALQGGMLEQRV